MDQSYLPPRCGAVNAAPLETRVAYHDDGEPYFVTVVPADALAPIDQDVRYAPAPTVSVPGVHAVLYQQSPPAHYAAPLASSYSPVRDPIVCRLLAGTVAVVGGAFALTFVLAALAAAETALGFLLGILAVIWLLSSSKGGGSGKAVNIKIINSNTSRRRR